MVADARCGLRREQVAAGGLEEFQHRLVFERRRIGEVDHHLRPGKDLFEPRTGDGVDAAVGRGGDDLVAALAQNGDGLRADHAGAANDDDLHGALSPLDDWRPLNGFDASEENAATCRRRQGPYSATAPARWAGNVARADARAARSVWRAGLGSRNC